MCRINQILQLVLVCLGATLVSGCGKPQVDLSQIEGYWFLTTKETYSTSFSIPKGTAPVLQFEASNVHRISEFPDGLKHESFFLLDETHIGYSAVDSPQATQLVFDQGQTATILELTEKVMRLHIELDRTESTYHFERVAANESTLAATHLLN